MYNLIINTNFIELIECDIESNINNYGIDNCKKIELKIKEILKGNNYSENITFSELYSKTQKNLIISSLCINDGKIKYFCNSITPDLEIYKAIKMSMLIPFLFIVEKFENNIYIDSGLVNGYPIDYFDNYDNNKILGIRICKKLDEKKIESFNDYLNSIINANLSNICSQKEKYYTSNTINIDINEYKLLDFNISNFDKNKLFLIGYKSAEKFIISNSLIFNKNNKNKLSCEKFTQTD